MSRNTQYQFVSTDTEALEAALVASYEKIVGIGLKPASPEMLFVKWVTNIIVQERVMNNHTGNQNVPSRAEGENLDALAELFYVIERLAAKAAVCTGRFHISEAQETAILVPAGTRVTDADKTLVWETVADVFVNIGDLYADVQMRCQTPGIIGNGYAAGQLNTIVDVYDYYERCENITASGSGADVPSDEEFYQLMRASMDGYSTAGALGGYVYFAKQASSEIEDVVANSPQAGHVRIYVLLNDGSFAGEELKASVLASCSKDRTRPLTDYVLVADPEKVEYDIDFTYYIPSDTALSSAEIQRAVEAAVEEYVAWQHAKFGRDINPSKLYQMLMATGIKRVDITAPVFTVLRDGKDGAVPQVAIKAGATIRNGGYEDE